MHRPVRFADVAAVIVRLEDKRLDAGLGKVNGLVRPYAFSGSSPLINALGVVVTASVTFPITRTYGPLWNSPRDGS